MFVNGCGCSIVVKTSHTEMDVPFSDETLREAVSFLQEEPSIEGDGVCRCIKKSNGVTGCVVTPLTIETAPLLLCLAMGAAASPVYVSETRNLFKHNISLLPMEDTNSFDLIQDRGMERRLYEGCKVEGFELRIMRGEAVKLKLEIYGTECQTSEMSGTGVANDATHVGYRAVSERFNGDNVAYKINEKEFSNIYGITLMSKKQGGTNTELLIKRALQHGGDIPAVIDEMVITAQLLRDSYENRHYGVFRITIKKMLRMSDETEITATDTVIGPVRYYVAGTVATEVFTSTGEQLQ